MNRIAKLGPHVVSTGTESHRASLLTQPPAPCQAHALLGPLHYEQNYAYPLVIWLHGPNDDERQVRSVIPHISTRNYVSVAPRGTTRMLDGSAGFEWEQSASAIAQAEQAVLDCIELSRNRYHVATERIFIAGFECGGTMALRLGIKHSELFAGAMSFGGPFPENHSPLANLKDARRLPLFIARGFDSRKYPPSRLREELKLFHAARLSIHLRLYPGGDGLTTKMLQDMDHWIMQQVTGQECPEEYDSSYGDTN